MDNIEYKAMELAKELIELHGGRWGPNCTAYWLDNATRKLVAPTMKSLKELGGGVGMMDTIFRLAISEQPFSDLVPEMTQVDGQAGLKAMTYQPNRNNVAVVRDYLQTLSSTDPQYFHFALGELLYQQMKDHHIGQNTPGLEPLFEFDINRIWDKWRGTDDTFGAVHLFVMAVSQTDICPQSRMEYTLDLILNNGCHIDQISNPEEVEQKTPLELACQLYEHIPDKTNHGALIGILIERGADWLKVDPGQYPQAWDFVRKHHVVRAWNNKNSLSQLAMGIRGEEISTTTRKAPKI